MTSIIGIKGDGNAVGNNNLITVVKQNHNHYGGGSGKKDEEDNSDIGAIAIGITVLIAGASFYFAIYADVVYILLRMFAGIETLAALFAVYAYSKQGASDIALKLATAAFFTGIGYVFLTEGHHDYPIQLTQLAQQASGVNDFWCGLNEYGRQLALLHTITTGLGFSLALLFMFPVAFIPAFFGMFEISVNPSTYATLERWTSWGVVVFGSFLISAASYFHSDTGERVWVNAIKVPTTLMFCQNHK